MVNARLARSAWAVSHEKWAMGHEPWAMSHELWTMNHQPRSMNRKPWTIKQQASNIRPLLVNPVEENRKNLRIVTELTEVLFSISPFLWPHHLHLRRPWGHRFVMDRYNCLFYPFQSGSDLVYNTLVFGTRFPCQMATRLTQRFCSLLLLLTRFWLYWQAVSEEAIRWLQVAMDDLDFVHAVESPEDAVHQRGCTCVCQWLTRIKKPDARPFIWTNYP